MSRVDQNQGLMPSLIDRLTDPESGGTTWRRGYGLEQVEAAVRRDLEDLLNTRQCLSDLPEHFVEVHRSVMTFGLPDLTSFNAVTTEQREDIGRSIEAIVARFEPRLKDIRAILADPGNNRERSVRFHIEAKLCLDPAPEVAFDTILELTTGHYSVKPSTT